MSEIFFSACDDCKNYIIGVKCKAFESIPNEILFEGNPHTSPFPGDNGIMYEPVDDNE